MSIETLFNYLIQDSENLTAGKITVSEIARNRAELGVHLHVYLNFLVCHASMGVHTNFLIDAYKFTERQKDENNAQANPDL